MKKSEFRNLIKRELIKEAKGTSYEAKLAEIESQGHITTLEAKIDAIAEMIDAKNDRLSLVNEDENLAELIDKKKIKEMQKEIKQLEKTKMKLEKLYEKKTGGKKKDVVTEDPSEEDMDHQDALDTASEEGDTKFMKEDARTDAEEEGYLDGMKDEKEDSMNEEFNLRKYMSENRLLEDWDEYEGAEEIRNDLKNVPTGIELYSDEWYAWKEKEEGSSKPKSIYPLNRTTKKKKYDNAKRIIDKFGI